MQYFETKDENGAATFWQVDDDGSIAVRGGPNWYPQRVITGGEAGLREYWGRDGVDVIEVQETDVV